MEKDQKDPLLSGQGGVRTEAGWGRLGRVQSCCMLEGFPSERTHVLVDQEAHTD